ncbi:cell division cycle-associated protein 7-like [Thalassophryne amazonica]|uniref:cell division cycle-associated protein 7-like n=1 Tax=Thalassophryne amazonica TaxID=390379 RepID=UPI00147090E4|nr:cell division cycle-associated protein 7-like [Thalassophryne amazonica]
MFDILNIFEAGLSGLQSLCEQLADVFADESESDQTFYGFSDSELIDQISDLGDDSEDQPDRHTQDQKSTSKPCAAARTFRLTVALHSTSCVQWSTDEDDAKEEEKGSKRRWANKGGRVKVKDVETSVARWSPSEEDAGSDSVEDESESFLIKREKNIKANKVMLAHLMADLQKIPDPEGFLKKQASKQHKGRLSVGVGGITSRKNPERVTRRQTRSMGGSVDPSAPQETELQLSLEEELLEVCRAPQRRGTQRPNQSKPHIVRPVEEITEDELQLVADNMTDKIYNRITGSTCHQCRQKTIDTKTCCRSETCRGIQGQFCGPCLRNRYGEDVRKVLLDPEWQCPPCRGICNCSFCRQWEGHCPTGILFPLAQYHGFSDVHSYLSSLQQTEA